MPSDLVLALEQIELLTRDRSDFWLGFYKKYSPDAQTLRMINDIAKSALDLSTNSLSPNSLSPLH